MHAVSDRKKQSSTASNSTPLPFHRHPYAEDSMVIQRAAFRQGPQILLLALLCNPRVSVPLLPTGLQLEVLRHLRVMRVMVLD